MVRTRVPPSGRARPGRHAEVGYEYEREWTCEQFAMREPPQGWRQVRVTRRRARADYAGRVEGLAGVHYPDAEKILRVRDDPDTHPGGSPHERFAPHEAPRSLGGIEGHYTPEHGSRPNAAETGGGIMGEQCLDRRTEPAGEVATRENERDERRARIHWAFTPAVAPQKLRRHYPSIEA